MRWVSVLLPLPEYGFWTASASWEIIPNCQISRPKERKMAARKEKGKKSPTEARDFPIIGWAESCSWGKKATRDE